MSKFKPDPSQSLGRRSIHSHPKADQVVQSLAKEETKRLHVHIPSSLHKQLKLRAAEEETDMTAVVVKALTAYLN